MHPLLQAPMLKKNNGPIQAMINIADAGRLGEGEDAIFIGQRMNGQQVENLVEPPRIGVGRSHCFC